MKEKTWLQTETQFCDECFLTCVKGYMMSSDQKRSLNHQEDMRDLLKYKEEQKKQERIKKDMELHMTKSDARMKFQKASRISGKLAVNMRDQGLPISKLSKLAGSSIEEGSQRKLSEGKSVSRKPSTSHHSINQTSDKVQEDSHHIKFSQDQQKPRNIRIVEPVEHSEVQVSDFTARAIEVEPN